MSTLLVLIVALGGPGLLPALAVARRSPVLIFLAPLIGAAMAATAAGFELGVGGSLLRWYAIVAVIVNIGTVAWWVKAGRFRPWPSPPWGWSIATAVTLVGVLIYPLTVLRARIMGRDANSIWLTHALMVFGGHHALLTGLQNPAYTFSNPDYPPLVPAADALALRFLGLGDLYHAVAMTELLTACALGALGAGIAAVAGNGRRLTRAIAVAAGGAICLVGFAVAGRAGIDGHVDLLWAAAAAAAVVWGLVLPRSAQALLVAWICAAVASLSKNEGLTTALIVFVLIAVRYVPLRRPGSAGRGRTARSRAGREAMWQFAGPWLQRAALAVVPALPGLAWAATIRHFGIHDAFFSTSAAEPLGFRANLTMHAMIGYLDIVPVALAVLLAGACSVRTDRRQAGLGNPAWLWIVWLGSLAAIFATYVFGGYRIQWWLGSSVDRTTIFAQLLLFAEITIWALIAAEAALAINDRRRGISPAQARESADPGPDSRPEHESLQSGVSESGVVSR
jgi:hypothetical protein